MRISAKGEYAAKAVLYLSDRYPDVVTIHEVAESHQIPVKYLEQILLALKRAELLESRRGVRGGYTLAREPARISVGEVLRAVDGRFSRTHCLESEKCATHACVEANGCGLRGVWKNLEEAVDQVLFGTSYADIGKNGDRQMSFPGEPQDGGAAEAAAMPHSGGAEE